MAMSADRVDSGLGSMVRRAALADKVPKIVDEYAGVTTPIDPNTPRYTAARPIFARNCREKTQLIAMRKSIAWELHEPTGKNM
jgi:hypothetical protein